MWTVLRQLATYLPELIQLLKRYGLGIQPAAPALEIPDYRPELASMSSGHALLQRQMEAQQLQLTAVEDEVRRLRMTLEHDQHKVEERLARMALILQIGGGMALVMLLTLVLLVSDIMSRGH